MGESEQTGQARYTEIMRRIAASIDQAEAEGRASYGLCLRCGALLDGEHCPSCDLAADGSAWAYRCKSGKHFWLSKADAAMCCTGGFGCLSLRIDVTEQ